MNSMLDRYIDGKFEYETGSLDFSCSRIEITLAKGENYEGEFTITCVGAERAEGYVLSTNHRLVIKNKTFTGHTTILRYTFNSVGLDEGETFRAEFHIISNKGEYYIPFVAMMEHDMLSSSLGNIKNLFHFANLAKTNWDEAVKLFYRPEFANVFNGTDKQFLTVYRGLSNVYGNEHNVDEFLVRINKKSHIQYIPMEEEIRVDSPYGDSAGRATITRNGWGYTKLYVETEGDFLSVEKEELKDTDFLGNLCSFVYHIDGSKLHAGMNYGSIRLYNAGTETTIRFVVSGEQKKSLKATNRKRLRMLNAELIAMFLSYRMRKNNTEFWLKESARIVNEMLEIDETNLTGQLMKTQLLLTEERVNEAKWMLGNLEKALAEADASIEARCYYLYLTSLANREASHVNRVTEQVEDMYYLDETNWKVAWLLLYLKEEYSKNVYKRYEFLKNQCALGCSSPVIYVEALLVLMANPTLLTEISSFELAVLWYGAKNDALNPELVEQLKYLVSKTKGYEERLFEILKNCYLNHPEEELLEQIVNLCVAGNRTDYEAYQWYRKAVESKLRVTKLYEYYVMSLPEDFSEQLPRIVMLYFAYNSELDYRKKAVLYANILQYREDFPEILENYRETIDAFLVEQIRMGHINRELAYLYKNALVNNALSRENYRDFLPLLFTNLIHVNLERATDVILVYDKVCKEEVYPLDEEKKAYVPIYSNDYALLVQDADGNRYIGEEVMEIHKLLIPGKFLKDLPKEETANFGFDLYTCDPGKSNVSISEHNAEAYRRLYDSERLEETVRIEIGLKLMRYYFDKDCLTEGEELLMQFKPEQMSTKERAVCIRDFINRGLPDKAYEWICRYGTEPVDDATLVKLCSRMISRLDFEQDEALLELAYTSFKKGKYDEKMIKYLAEYYEGMAKDLRDIWQAARGFEIDTMALCERILLQILFTGAFVGQKEAIFEEYVKGGGRLLVQKAYLTSSAYEYFIHEKIVDEKIFLYLKKLYYRGENFHKGCRYAYIKYYAENREAIGEEERTLLGRFVNECLAEHVYFPFFKDLVHEVKEVQKGMNKTIIEYRSNPKVKAFIHYVLEREDEVGEYITEEMTNVYEGIFLKPFTLFFGEKLQYYITEVNDGEDELTQSDTIQIREFLENPEDSKYYMINDMMVAKTLKEHSTVDELLQEYYHRDALVDELFGLL